MRTWHVRNRGYRSSMKIKHQVVAFDAAELAAESEFWAGLLGRHGRRRGGPLREPYRVDLALCPDLQRHAASSYSAV